MVDRLRRAAANAEDPVVAPGANPDPADPANIVIRMMEPMLAIMSKAIVEAMTTGATTATTVATMLRCALDAKQLKRKISPHELKREM